MTQNKSQNMKQLSVGSMLMILVLILMILASEVLGEKEIIFPEVAALCVGSFLLPHVMWKAHYLKMILYIALCAILGVLVVVFLPFPLWAQFCLAFMVAQFIFYFSGTGLAPMISAMVLPVLIQTKSYIYILSAILLTALVVLFTLFHSRYILHEKKETKVVTLPRKEFLLSFIFRSVIALVVVVLCTTIDLRFKFCIAPPLLVAFTEMTTNKNAPGLKRPWVTILLFTVCAFCGAASRYILTMQCGLPLTVSVIPTSVGVILALKGFHLPFPPAAAMGVLAMLIPDHVVLLYTLEVFLGITIWTLSAVVWKKILWREEKKPGRSTLDTPNPTKAVNSKAKDEPRESLNDGPREGKEGDEEEEHHNVVVEIDPTDLGIERETSFK